ncbi:MAG: mannose-6-phosphate isomerase, class I [Bacteroidales bacterium]|nr:mannose-6-phosphate isomerase, class I [Bacteroidales bacterium]
MLYPLKFKPIYKTKVWGGDKIAKIKNDSNVPADCGESWEISGVEGDVSVVANGFLEGNTLQEIIEVYLDEVVGEKVLEEYGYEFPILLKIIDAKENLSVQVHPDDETAAELHNARGKTEAWYILEADKDAKIIDGFNRDTTENELLQSIKDGNLENLLKYHNVKSGEFYFIPAGRVHGMCAGTAVVEIQETSDVTYRIYDYNRGNRELHTQYAVDVIDYKKNDKQSVPFTRMPDHSNPIVDCKCFTTNYLPVMNSLLKDYSNLDSFVIYHCVHGQVTIKTADSEEILNEGESILIPACIDEVVLIPIKYSELLEVYMNLGESKPRKYDDYDIDTLERSKTLSYDKSCKENNGSSSYMN